MTKEENKLRIKAEALNAIRKIYHPKTKNPYSQWPEDGSYADQRDFWVRSIIENMEKELIQNKKRCSKCLKQEI